MAGTPDVVTADVVIAGGGVIGTAIAWRAAAAGLDVVLVDPGRGDAASAVAAGMLAPVSEALFGEGALLRVNLLAVQRFGAFAAELEEASGQQVGLRREGTLAIAYDTGDLRRADAPDRVPPLGRAASRGTGQPGLPQAGARSSPRMCTAACCSPGTGRWITAVTPPRCARQPRRPGCGSCPAR